MQWQNCNSIPLCILLHTHRSTNTVGLGVDEAAYLCEIAVALDDVLNRGGLHEECVIGGKHPLNALLHTLHHD